MKAARPVEPADAHEASVEDPPSLAPAAPAGWTPSARYARVTAERRAVASQLQHRVKVWRQAGPGTRPSVVQQRSRPLLEREVRYAREIFWESIQWERVLIVRHDLASIGGVARSIGNSIYVPEIDIQREGAEEFVEPATLIHELVHVWQYQNGGIFSFLTSPIALLSQAASYLTTGSSEYAYTMWTDLDRMHVPWRLWNPEAQARCVEDFNDSLRTVQAANEAHQPPDPSHLRLVNTALPYIRMVRARQGA